jgi:hypothetical protein
MKSKDISSLKEGLDVEIIYNGEREELDNLLDMPEFMSLIMEESLNIIKQGIKQKSEKVKLFNVINLGVSVELHKDNYKKALNKIILYYSDLEEYEICNSIKKLIKKI